MTSKTQNDQLDRVSSRISAAIMKFRRTIKRRFHAEELRKFVRKVVGHTAPGSADRVLRHLRQLGKLDYVVLNRAESLYKWA